MMMDETGGGVVLTFFVLTEQIPGPDEETTRWLARSTTTGHVGQGTSEGIALDRLFSGIKALLAVALANDGVTPQEW